MKNILIFYICKKGLGATNAQVFLFLKNNNFFVARNIFFCYICISIKYNIMDRQKQIEEAAKQNTLDKNQGHYYSDWYFGFINGAEWADEHPVAKRVDIKKVCEWLDINIYDYEYEDDDGTTCINVNDLTNDLWDVMKGE